MGDVPVETYFRAMYLMASELKFDKDVLIELIDEFPLNQSTKDELFEASQFIERYNENGVVIMKHIYPSDKCLEFTREFWDYMLSLPYKSHVKAEITELIDKLGLREDPWRKISKADMKKLREYYPMTGGFGALTLPPAFHMNGEWDARQDHVIVSAFGALLDTRDLEVTLDRVSFKFPGQGMTEFTHWDSNPWTWPQEEYEGIQGILALSNTTFRGVPKTHTEKFRAEFIGKYPRSRRTDQYHVGGDMTLEDALSYAISNDLTVPERITKEKKGDYFKRVVSFLKGERETFNHTNFDPMELRNQVVDYSVEPGDVVVWSNRLLHEARMNKTDQIRYAMFLSYYPAGKINPEVRRVYEKSGVDYYEDRLHSYKTGMNPLAFPSGTLINLYPKLAWMCAAKTLTRFCDMWQPDAKACVDRAFESGKKKGTSHPIVVEWNPRDLGFYTPPKLTDVGVKLLGRS